MLLSDRSEIWPASRSETDLTKVAAEVLQAKPVLCVSIAWRFLRRRRQRLTTKWLKLLTLSGQMILLYLQRIAGRIRKQWASREYLLIQAQFIPVPYFVERITTPEAVSNHRYNYTWTRHDGLKPMEARRTVSNNALGKAASSNMRNKIIHILYGPSEKAMRGIGTKTRIEKFP